MYESRFVGSVLHQHELVRALLLPQTARESLENLEIIKVKLFPTIKNHKESSTSMHAVVHSIHDSAMVNKASILPTNH